MPKYKHPSIDEGHLSIGDERYEIVGGVVDCPVDFAGRAEVALEAIPDPVEEEKRKKKPA